MPPEEPQSKQGGMEEDVQTEDKPVVEEPSSLPLDGGSPSWVWPSYTPLQQIEAAREELALILRSKMNF